MKNHHEVGHFKNRLMILLLSLFALVLTAGQSFAADCTTCHGMPPLDSSDGSRNPGTGAFKGSHQTHVNPTGTVAQLSAQCVKCHNSAGHNNTHAATDGYNISIAANIYASPSTARYSRGTSFPQSNASNPTLGTCRNVSCHFETITPNWGKSPTAPTATNCNTCHATPRGASGSHAKHEAAYGQLNSCAQCHPYYGFGSYSTTASESKFSHATSVTRHKIVTKTFLTYSGGSTTSVLPSQPNNYGTCRATLCHDTGRDNPRTPVWGATPAACTACHALKPITGSHTKHLSVLNAAQFGTNASGYMPVTCNNCHKGYVEGNTASADHLNGYVDVFYVTKGDLGSSYTATRGKSQTFASCNTSYCHSNGSVTNRLYGSAAWGGIPSSGCDFCHPLANLSLGHSAHIGTLLTEINFYNYTTNKSTTAMYKFGCGSCHPNTVSNHLDGSVDVILVGAAGGNLKAKNLAGAKYDFSSNKCNNVYCHSNGYLSGTFKCVTTIAWTQKFNNYTAVSKGGRDKCAWCHGNSPNTATTAPAPVRVGSPAHSAHVVGIHFDDIFNGVSKKLPISGAAAVNAAHGKDSRSTTINCNICHAATMTASANDKNTQCLGCHNGSTAPIKNPAELISDKSKHVNGLVDVSFINQKIATKAQVANSSFAAYTAKTSGWARRSNGMPFKTYTSSYDVTKNTLSFAASAYTTGAGCQNIACHASITVKWADTVTCQSCHTRLK